MIEPISALSAAIPLLTEGGKTLIDILRNKFAPDVVRPANVQEAIALQDAQVKLFSAMNNIGGESYPWVEAIIKLQRPLVVVVVMLAWCYSHLTGVVGGTDAVDNAASAVGFYLFADRTLFYVRKAGK